MMSLGVGLTIIAGVIIAAIYFFCFARYHPKTGEFEWFSKGDLLRECGCTPQAASAPEKEKDLPESSPPRKTGE